MVNRYALGGLRDDEVLNGVSRLVARINVLTSDLLAHLVEVDARMLYAELGFPNLFSYCVESLGLSEGAAGRRCLAARVCRRFPEAFWLVAKGELHLSALCALAKHLEPENAAELFDACRKKSRRRIDEILAARFPRPDAKESIRQQREIEPTSAGRYRVQFTADAALHGLVERARALSPDHVPEGALAELFRRALTLFVAEQEKRRFAVGRKPRGVAKARENNGERSTPPAASRGVQRRRAIKASVRRIVHERDNGRCAWVSADGKRCSSRERLQFDHVRPWAMGPDDEAPNLRLLCPCHNRLHAKHCFGAVHMAAKVAARRAARQRTPG